MPLLDLFEADACAEKMLLSAGFDPMDPFPDFASATVDFRDRLAVSRALRAANDVLVKNILYGQNNPETLERRRQHGSMGIDGTDWDLALSMANELVSIRDEVNALNVTKIVCTRVGYEESPDTRYEWKDLGNGVRVKQRVSGGPVPVCLESKEVTVRGMSVVFNGFADAWAGTQYFRAEAAASGLVALQNR